MQKLDYKLAPEMFTCHACFFMSQHFTCVAAEVEEQKAELKAFRAGYEQAWGLVGVVPSVVFNGLAKAKATHVNHTR